MNFHKQWPHWLHLIRWDRPAGWLLLLWPTLSALWVAAGGWPGWHLVLVFVAGTILMRSAGCCINDVADRDFDRHVQRTAHRPVTLGLVSVREALAVGGLLATGAFLLVLTLHPEVLPWSIAALGVTLVYPFTKRWFSMPQAVLGVAFGMGIPMAFVAVQGHVPLVGTWMMLGNFFWVLAYDTEYAMVDREDDRRIGIRTSALTLGDWDVAAVMVFSFLHLAVWVQVGRLVFASEAYYWVLSSSLLQLALHWYWIRKRGQQGCFRAFSNNHWIGLQIFVAWVIGLA